MGPRRFELIDHIFMLVEEDAPEIAHLPTLGLVETYRRVHLGQGTRNICYCFDNLYLEMLWVDNPEAARSPAIARTGLYERSLWRSNGTCPFGIAWRRSSIQPNASKPSTWAYEPPYLPPGMSIAVATDSDDPRQPMMFELPGSMPPLEWPVEKRGSLQRGAGLGAVIEISLSMPSDAPPSQALRTVAQYCTPRMLLGTASTYALQLRIAPLDPSPDLVIKIPL